MPTLEISIINKNYTWIVHNFSLFFCNIDKKLRLKTEKVAKSCKIKFGQKYYGAFRLDAKRHEATKI